MSRTLHVGKSRRRIGVRGCAQGECNVENCVFVRATACSLPVKEVEEYVLYLRPMESILGACISGGL